MEVTLPPGFLLPAKEQVASLSKTLLEETLGSPFFLNILGLS